MEFEPQLIATPPPIVPLAPASNRQLIAPVWHTIAMVLLFLVNSYFSATHLPTMHEGPPSERTLMLQYGVTIGFEFFLLLLVWVGLVLKGTKMRELIAGRWATVEDFLLDLALAVGFVVVAFVVLGIIGTALGMRNPSQAGEVKRLANMLGPQSRASLGIFILVSCTAGLVEEILFRGYLQRQIGAITGNIYVGLIVSAILFGLGHGYQGARRMVLIAVLGAMFGLLALMRKSLRPGMMAHAFFDSVEGVLLWLVRKGAIPIS